MLVSTSPWNRAALPRPPRLGSGSCGLRVGSAMSSCRPLFPSVGLRGHAAADPGCHGDQLLHSMDAGDFWEQGKGSVMVQTPDDSLGVGTK